ncbi:MAG: ECF-type sigma factor [Blastocatellia bacterium]|jgi:RNA polymerase sigma factor (TIGR02999 family)
MFINLESPLMGKKIEDRLKEITEPITLLIGKVREGDNVAREELWKIFFPLLKQKADFCLRGNNVAAVMSPSDLVQDASMVLLKCEEIGWNDRAHLYAFAATVMRHIIIDRARKHLAKNRIYLPIDDLAGAPVPQDPSVLEIDEVLHQLTQADPVRARVFELRFFGGLTNEEIAHVTGVSLATVKRYWTFSRAFILSRLGEHHLPQES